jgi:hypothetical protein
MQRTTGSSELVLASSEIDRVVRVAPISRAATSEDESTVSELTQVVGDQVLWLVDELSQFPHRTITTNQFLQQSPPQRMGDQPHEPRRVIRLRPVGECRLHGSEVTESGKIDQSRLMESRLRAD